MEPFPIKWIKSKVKTLLIMSGIVVVAFAANDLTANEVSKSKLNVKYEQSQLKEKYKVDGASLKATPKDDPKDMIKVKLGDENATEFEPSLEISRWDEVSFKIKPKGLDKIAAKDKDLKFEGDKIKFETPDVDYHLYEMPIDEVNPEGAFEYEVILKKKPKTNVIEFQLDTQGLDFFYQPELTAEEIAQGAFRPENVIGSYAVYCSEQKTNWTDGKLYRTGKVGHIYRPRIIDSAGTEIWGVLNIDKGILSVTIPQDFLDKAVYPIRHAAGLTFGYEGTGGSSSPAADDWLRGNIGTPAQTGIVNTVEFYSRKGTGAAKNVIGGIYSSQTVVMSPQSAAVAISSTTVQWWHLTITNGPTVSGSSTYWVSVIGDYNALSTYFYYDTGSFGTNNSIYRAGIIYPNWPTNGIFDATSRYSIYATYTPGGSTTTAPTITNSTGASDISTSSATLNANLTEWGNTTTTVHIYWGDNDGVTTTGNWDTDANLGEKVANGLASTTISSLTASTTYFYRASATNASGTAWAASTETFDTTAYSPATTTSEQIEIKSNINLKGDVIFK